MLYTLLGAVAIGLVIGLVLGLLGSGGSILTVPVLVYLAGQPGTRKTHVVILHLLLDLQDRLTRLEARLDAVIPCLSSPDS